MHSETIKSAQMLISHAEKACGHKCKRTPRYVIKKLQEILDTHCKDYSYDVEDAISDIYVEFVIKRQFRKFSETLIKVLENRGKIEKDDEGNWKSTAPEMEEIFGTSNDDDLQGEEITANDMHKIASVEMGPGSDAHIAAIDIEDHFGSESREIFECLLGGATELEIADLTGLSRDQVKRRRRNIESFLARHEYTLAPVNCKLGSIMYFRGQKYSFPAAKDSLRKHELPVLNWWVCHRGITYTDRKVKDLSKPLAPTGDKIRNEGLGYETNIGVDTLHADDQLNAKPEVTEVSWEDFPGGVDNRPQFSQYGDPAKWAPRQDSDESIQRMCNEIFETYKRG